MTPGVTAVIVNYNAGAELRQALESIAADLGDAPWEAVVVDNASTDGSAETVLEFQPHAALLRNPQNVGFGRPSLGRLVGKVLFQRSLPSVNQSTTADGRIAPISAWRANSS